MSLPELDWRTAVLTTDGTIKAAIDCLNRTGLQIVLILDAQGKLKGTITDGDIRRGILKGLTLDSLVESVMREDSLVVPPALSASKVSDVMKANKVRQLPIVDDAKRVIGLHVWDEIELDPLRSNVMVIMAGGLGRRLLPHTESCPKPMLDIAGKPILEHIIDRAKREGFRKFVITINYLGHIIENHFGNGSNLDVEIEYVREQQPLGTAGALGLLTAVPAESFFVVNGDVLSDIRYADLMDFHVKYQAAATMAVQQHEWQHPFGVVHTEGVDIVSIEEKPVVRTRINTGIYVLDPMALQVVVHDTHIDMPTLFSRLQSLGYRTVAYPMHEPWLDIGRPADLAVATNSSVVRRR
jgi:dTDP-glucose pyrophosphorylase